MMGYEEEEKTTVLELTYNYGVTEYTKGNAYAQVNSILLLSDLDFLLENIFLKIDDCYSCMVTRLPLAPMMSTRVGSL